MKTIKQLLRQPLKTAIGIVIVALAFAILVICVGQYTVTDLSRENLDDRYTTIGLLSSEYFREKTDRGYKYLSKLSEGKQNWIDWLISSRTDIVKTVSSTGLTSAYIPELTIDNFSRYDRGYNMGMYNSGQPYRCAMLTVTLTKIGSVETKNSMYIGAQECITDTTILCVSTVESVIGLEKGFAPPIGKEIVLQIKVPSKDAFDALNLEVGQTYLVFGDNYCDNRYELIGEIDTYQPAFEELFGSLFLSPDSNRLLDYDPMLEQFDCVLTVCDPASMPAWRPTNFDSTGNPNNYVRSDQYEVHYIDGEKIKRKWVSAEEFVPYYQLPTITPLNSAVDEFLTSEDGALWQEALDKMEINNHAFPILCVEKLGYQAVFAREQARIVDGRDFTENELINGDKVCIISQTVATKSGLKVGDTIELRTYDRDLTINDHLNEMMAAGSFPYAAFYSETLGFSSEMETYAIVGLYRQEDAWQNAYDAYGFTPNTIFIPKTSVAAKMEIRDKGLYYTLVLENGKLEEFKALMEEAGLPDLFICYDQGYSEFMASLDAYEEVSQKAFYIGFAAFVVIVLLFLLLYPAQQKRSLMLMGTLGASAWGRFTHTFISILCALIPGAALGGYVGSKLWTRIAAALMEWINIEIALESDMTAIAPKLTAASLAVVTLAALIVSAALCRNRGLMKRK